MYYKKKKEKRVSNTIEKGWFHSNLSKHDVNDFLNQEYDDDDDFDKIDEEESKRRLAKLNINLNLFCIDFDTLSISRLIGSGGYCKVYLGEIPGPLKVAFKCFSTNMLGDDEHDFGEFERELTLMSSLSHPGLPRFFGCTLKPPRVGILMEYCENGNLKQYFTGEGSSTSMSVRLRILKELAAVTGFIHAKSVIHRDIKPENVLLDDSVRVKLIDFGLSVLLKKRAEKQNMTQGVGTSLYMAPEVYRGEDYNEKCDVFSYSIIMWSVLHPKNSFLPYGLKESYGIQAKVANNPRFRPKLEEISYLPQKFAWVREIMVRCWSDNPSDRYSFHEINRIFSENKKYVTTFYKENLKLKNKLKKKIDIFSSLGKDIPPPKPSKTNRPKGDQFSRDKKSSARRYSAKEYFEKRRRKFSKELKDVPKRTFYQNI